MSHEGGDMAAHGTQPLGHFAEQLYDEHGNPVAQASSGMESHAYLQHGDVSDAAALAAAAGYLTHEAHAYVHSHQDAFQVHVPDIP